MSTPLARWIGRDRVEFLHRRLGTRALPAPGSPNPQRVARAAEAAVIRVEIDLDLAGATPRLDPHRQALGPLGKLVEPTNHRPEIDRVELPHHVTRLHDNPQLMVRLTLAEAAQKCREVSGPDPLPLSRKPYGTSAHEDSGGRHGDRAV